MKHDYFYGANVPRAWTQIMLYIVVDINYNLYQLILINKELIFFDRIYFLIILFDFSLNKNYL